MPAEFEPKWKAVKRLKLEGRYLDFLKKKAEFPARVTGPNGYSRDERFYLALSYFPPIVRTEEADATE
jgi:hypothetical protein